MHGDFINQNVLCTCQSWFIAPDGVQYRAIWGKLKAIHEAGKTLGFIPNRSHANWYYEIGEAMIMGCQVLYLIKCEEEPATGPVKDYSADASSGIKEYERPSLIYICK
jgi:hypothetical protein